MHNNIYEIRRSYMPYLGLMCLCNVGVISNVVMCLKVYMYSWRSCLLIVDGTGRWYLNFTSPAPRIYCNLLSWRACAASR